MPAPADPEIMNVYATKFVDDFVLLSQQRGSRLRNTVREDPSTIDAKQAVFDRIGKTDPVKRTALFEKTPHINTPFSRRVAVLEDWVWADLLDPMSLERMMKNPQNRMVMSATWAMGRKVDDIVIAAAIGAAKAMAADDTTSDVTLPAGQKLGDGTKGFTLHDWLLIKEKHDAAEVDDQEKRYLVIAAAQLRGLLEDTKLTSSDYNTVKALVDGKVDTFLGYDVIRTERLPLATGKRTLIAYTEMAIGFCHGDDILRRMTERDDLNYSLQMWMQMGLAAVRLEEERVVTFEAAEPAPAVTP